MIVQDVTRTQDYVLQGDRVLPSEQQTIFKIGTLSKRQFAEALTVIGKYQQGQAINDMASFLDDIERFIRLGLRGWSNLRTAQREDVPFDLERIGELFTPVDLQELVLAIISFNTIEGRDRKNST